MYHYVFRQWLVFFYFYCIFGWVFESTYVSLKSHKRINRGFMRGPWLPIYGSGAIVILFCTLPFQGSPVMVYLVGMIAATVLEYVTGVCMVKLFKVRYWDYSYQKIQFQGHICLTSSLAWGFLSLLMVYVVHKPVERVIFSIPGEVVSVGSFLITVCISYDFAIAFKNAMDLRRYIIRLEESLHAYRLEMQKNAEELADNIKEDLDTMMDKTEEFVENIKDKTEEFSENLKEKMDQELEEKREQIEKLREKIAVRSGYVLSHNPGSSFHNLKEETELIKIKIREYKSKRK